MGKRYKKRSSNKIRNTYRLMKEAEATLTPVTKEVGHEINLSDTERITYIKAVDDKNKIMEVVNISYDIRVAETWVTILRYDSQHGYLHCHIRLSYQDSSESIIDTGLIKRGGPQTWFTWAIDDIKHNHLTYRKKFLKRSNILDNEY